MCVIKRISDTILGTSITKPGRLVMCFTKLYVNFPNQNYYKFISYPIQKLITKSDPVLLKPDAQFTWWEEMDWTYRELVKSEAHGPPYFAMSLLNVGDLVYAVGGARINEEVYKDLAKDLPKDFTCISLSASLQNSKVKMKALHPMHQRKYKPIIVEIGGLIYVLSSPSYGYRIVKPFFEVYNPSKDEWASLPDPPFSMLGDKVDRCGLSYVVIGASLYVTSHRCSCIFDTKLEKWKTCYLFSDFYPSSRVFNLSARCGPPFPFMVKPILCKEKFLLIPMRHHLLAFHITDENKAVEIPIKFNPPLHCGRIVAPIVDLGDDYFAVMVYGFGYYSESDIDNYYSSSEVSMATFKLQVETGNGGFFLKGTIVSMDKV